MAPELVTGTAVLSGGGVHTPLPDGRVLTPDGYAVDVDTLRRALAATPVNARRSRESRTTAYVEWLSAVPMSKDVAALVWGLAGDGGAGPWLRMPEEDRATAYAISIAARGIAVWGSDRLLAHLARTRKAVSRP
ncbi:hypothetical protein R1T08_00775 [Streptomyces sp. SBC-4]|nr:hypothetical protein [Streptomyces sp. SBC-4]MDV5142895.1 hypothetical protein [Streptomyces sp. SBC-4]